MPRRRKTPQRPSPAARSPAAPAAAWLHVDRPPSVATPDDARGALAQFCEDVAPLLRESPELVVSVLHEIRRSVYLRLHAPAVVAATVDDADDCAAVLTSPLRNTSKKLFDESDACPSTGMSHGAVSPVSADGEGEAGGDDTSGRGEAEQEPAAADHDSVRA